MLFLADSFGVAFRGRTVLSAASVWAETGLVTALLGRNGSGKSTLLRAALGLGPRLYGTVRFCGRIYWRPRLSILARSGLFFVPSLSLLSRRHSLAWHMRAVLEWSRESEPPAIPPWIDLENLLSKKPGDMSGGERRRAELALALARRPTCLILDEFFSELAPIDRDRAGDTLRSVAAGGCAVLVTGHEVEALLRCADSVIWLTAGTTHGLGSPREAIRHGQFRNEYLGDGFGTLSG